MFNSNPNARVPFTYREFFAEAMQVLPKLRYVDQNNVALYDLCTTIAVEAFLLDKQAPLTKQVMMTINRYNEVSFKP